MSKLIKQSKSPDSAKQSGSNSNAANVTVTQEQLDLVEYLMAHSAQGVHALFENEWIRDAYAGPAQSQKKDQRGAVLLARLIEIPSVRGKRFYIENLKTSERRQLIRVYLSVVSNAGEEKDQVKH